MGVARDVHFVPVSYMNLQANRDLGAERSRRERPLIVGRVRTNVKLDDPQRHIVHIAGT